MDPDKTLILDANKEYWIAGLPYLDGIDSELSQMNHPSGWTPGWDFGLGFNQ